MTHDHGNTDREDRSALRAAHRRAWLPGWLPVTGADVQRGDGGEKGDEQAREPGHGVVAVTYSVAMPMPMTGTIIPM